MGRRWSPRSPTAADPAIGRFVLDVNPTRTSWAWIPTAALVRGMRTFDTVENRGYIVVSPQ